MSTLLLYKHWTGLKCSFGLHCTGTVQYVTLPFLLFSIDTLMLLLYFNTLTALCTDFYDLTFASTTDQAGAVLTYAQSEGVSLLSMEEIAV